MGNASDCCAGGDASPPPIACTLQAGDFRERTAAIRDLAARSLLRSRRERLALHLTYGPEALAELEDLVAREAECCAFLAFDLRREAGRIHLTITAPEAAAAAADDLFAHFAPERARDPLEP